MISTEKPGPVVVPHAAGASDGRARTEVRDSAGQRGLAVGSVLLVGLLGVLYWPILVKLVADWWDDPNYSHGFLVPVFSAYLVWQRRAALTAEVPRGSWRAGLPVLLVGLALLVLGEVGAERFLAASSLVVVLAAFMLLHLGPAIARRLAFPLAYLLFAIPIPAVAFYAIAFPLQQLSATNAAWTLDLLGVPVMLDGNVIHLSQITLGVTEACSGIRSLVSMLALAVAWGALMFGRAWATALLAAAAVPITVIANAGRVVATGLIGQYLGIEYATGFFHTLSGWVIFVIAFVGLLGVYVLLRRIPALQRTPEPASAHPDGTAGERPTGHWNAAVKPSARVLVSAGLLAATFLGLQLRGTGEAIPLRKPLSAFPATLGEWQAREATLLDGDTLQVLRPTDYLVRREVDPAGRTLWLYVGYWDSQRKGAAQHSPKNCLPGGGWEPLEASKLTIPLAGHSAPLTVNRFLIQKDRDQQVVLYWYLAQGRPVAGEVEARVEMVRNAIFRHRTDGAIVRVSSPVYGSLPETTAWLVRYVQVLYPALGDYLPG